jgi:hypothetical protein
MATPFTVTYLRSVRIRYILLELVYSVQVRTLRVTSIECRGLQGHLPHKSFALETMEKRVRVTFDTLLQPGGHQVMPIHFI